uniref:Putative ovule protein n=1 Tax=Solanum chacoense TaxID=4108 RepID=A0A0V0H341_SOLCH
MKFWRVVKAVFSPSFYRTCCYCTFLSSLMTGGNFPTSSRPSFGKLEKQFEEFRHRLEELGSLRKRIWVVVKYLSESL